MKELKEFFRRIKLVRQRSSNLSKIVVIVTILLCTVSLITLRLAMKKIEDRTQDLRNQASVLEEENAGLEEKIDQLGSVQSDMEIAREELGLVNPDAVLLEPEE